MKVSQFSSGNMKILIVDDSPRMRGLIIKMLNDGNNEFFECKDGWDAFSSYVKIQPDVVIMDINMKKMNGLDSAYQILSQFSDAIIIMVTNFNEPIYRRRAEISGIKHYILKDNLTNLKDIIMKYDSDK